MKLAVTWFWILYLALISAGLFTRNDLSAARRNVSDSQSTGSLNNNRHRTLFARRGKYERQRIYVPKPRVVPVPSDDLEPPAKVSPKPVKPSCSQLTQSCQPLSGCCDRCASCHCRFFNAICYCRKTNTVC
ncbi:agouti-signaling protein-like [Acanthopagrus latus]|uniref:agouti-signaling protein-like n=1 Tax=Acanthopagrus latus TaxID=8177 RepID=UPI00187BD99D|nr:agouti-signaling protein-like [Acanthopagrus latus]